MKKMIILAATLALALLTIPAVAHHAFSAEFDENRPVRLKGKVIKMDWVNPHAWVHLEVKDQTGGTQTWMVECGTPNTLFRRGFTKDSLEPGTEIVVDGYQSKDRTAKANGRDVTLPDGTRLFLGSSGTGAPKDGADPRDRPNNRDR